MRLGRLTDANGSEAPCAVEAIWALNGKVLYGCQRDECGNFSSHRFPPWWPPGWVVGLLGEDFFGKLNGLTSGRMRGSSDFVIFPTSAFCILIHRGQHLQIARGRDVAPASRRPALPILESFRSSCLAAPAIAVRTLKDLPQLRVLCLNGTEITDADLRQVSQFPQLEVLEISGTAVTDKGLEYLKPLKVLGELCLQGTQVTDAGLTNLKGFADLKQLFLDRTSVTDAGLNVIKDLPGLRHLGLRGTRVTEDGVKKLQRALPNCEIG